MNDATMTAIAEKIARIEKRLRNFETQTEVPGNYTTGSIPYSLSTGFLAEDNSNFYWDATNKRLGIGTASPATALDVRGIASIQNMYVSPGNNIDSFIELGINNTGNRNSYIDFRGDDTYTDYGLRVIRTNAGANAPSAIIHRGTGALRLQTLESAAIEFYTNKSVIRNYFLGCTRFRSIAMEPR